MYFIDIDIRTSVVYVIPYKQIKGLEFTIACENRYRAEQVKALLTSGELRSPIKNNEQFKLFEQFEKFGKSLSVYKVR